MLPALKMRACRTRACRKIGTLAALATGLTGPLSVPAAVANDTMPAAQQNALVQKYCAVCHTDAARNGGLSLQHFDAAHLDPSLAAMLLSKLNGGAFGAAGLPIPDKATADSFTATLASEAAGAHEWTVYRTKDAATKQPVLTAGILREVPPAEVPPKKVPPAKNARGPSMYRLVLTCNTDTHRGEMQLSWAPSPKVGTLSASLDGKAPLTYQVEGAETMGNGAQGTTGPAAINLLDTTKASGAAKLGMPVQTLTIGNLFPNETVMFPFDALTQQTREAFSTCFPGRGTGQ
jgi:hypothetical protein